MPELPEVETVRRQLEPAVVGRTIERAEVLDERWTRPEPPGPLARALAGRRIEAVDRRGKYLVVRLDDGSSLVMHLRMTGNLLLRPPGSDAVADLMATERFGGPRLYESHPEARHLRARIVLDDGAELWFTDARRAGLSNGGSSIDDYRDARGERGSMQDEFLVHTRAGEPCPRCGEEIRRVVVAGRSTYFCPGCQRRLRARPRRRRTARR
jgi:formamidopyrimidine-DNA glycosylase